MSRGRAKNRPPRLEPRVVETVPSAPPTPEQLLQRAKIAGPRAAPGATELRRFVGRIVADGRGARGTATAPAHCSPHDVWAALGDVYGATPVAPTIDPARTLAHAARAGEHIRRVAAAGRRIAFVTAAPASMLGVHLAAARTARAAGAEIVEDSDAGPFRADGRAGRALRWIDGVATVTDGRSLLGTSDDTAAGEWLFAIPRPALVVADGPFAEAAWDAGLDVVVFAGLDRAGLAVPAARAHRCTLVPCRTDRHPSGYAPIVARLVTPEM